MCCYGQVFVCVAKSSSEAVLHTTFSWLHFTYLTDTWKSLVVLAQVSQQGFILCQIKSTLAFKFVDFCHFVKHQIKFRRKINSGIIHRSSSEMHSDLTTKPQTIGCQLDCWWVHVMFSAQLKIILPVEKKNSDNTNWKSKQFRYSFPKQLTAFQSSCPWQCPCALAVKEEGPSTVALGCWLTKTG